MFDDTGYNVCESHATLLAQQSQLLEERRLAQMFPKGSPELSVPKGFERVETKRGVFHFDPVRISAAHVKEVSDMRRENELLALGPFNKADVVERLREGERLFAVTERTVAGLEIKAVVGTTSMLSFQIEALEASKSPQSIVAVELLDQVLAKRWAAHEQEAH